MGLLTKVLYLIHAFPILSAVIFVIILETGWLDNRLRPEKPPIVDKYWGSGLQPSEEDATIHPFKVEVPDDVLDDLKSRLQNSRISKGLEGVNFQYGMPSAFLEEIRTYWLEKYDWRSWEKELNSLPQFKTKIDGLDIHFIHVKPNPSPDHKVLPLLLLHGWPGSILEFYKIIPLLTKPRPNSPYVFEVVAPSLPGYGWSEAAKKEGLEVSNMGLIFSKLMKRLNLAEPAGFYVQGGDWGSLIGNVMARMQPKLVRGLHINMLLPPTHELRYVARLLLGTVFPRLVLPANDTAKVYPYTKVLVKMLRETGYMHIQATRPDTVESTEDSYIRCAALNDSPIGLAAYIIEKFAAWTDLDFQSKADGGLNKHFSKGELLTNVMIYWITGSITTSQRLYKETFSRLDNPWMRQINEVPTGAANFPNDLGTCPERWLRFHHVNLLQYTDMPRGGHFAALEEPVLLTNDLFKFVGTAEAWRTQPDEEAAKTDL